jgi:hypothetical protein
MRDVVVGQVVKSDARQKRLHCSPLDYIRLLSTLHHTPRRKKKLGSKFMHR